MRKLIITVILAAAAVLPGFAKGDGGRLDAMWDNANTLYVNGDYSRAINAYEEIVAEGYGSSKLYYNLGNAYFKNNEIGRAILNYNRAQRLAPSDGDIAYNLEVANGYVKDRIEPVPQFFLSGWVRSLRTSLSSNVWAVISLVLLAVGLGCVLLYVYSRKKSLRKAGFFTAVVSAVFFVVAVSFAGIERRKITDSSQAVITTQAASVKSSPDRASKDLFELHEGTKVEVLNVFGDWKEIMIRDGNKGWILTSAIEMI